MILLLKLLLFAVILYLAFRSLRTTLEEVQSANWPTASATVTLSRSVEAPIGQRRGFLGSHAWQVQYTYTIDGKSHKSGLVAPFPNTTEANAQMMADRMPVDTQFNVRYKPTNHSDTRLATNRAAGLLRLIVQLIIYTAAIIIVFATSFTA